MTNEELLERIANGDEAALTKLCLINIGLVKERARLIAQRYHCLRKTKYGSLSDYAKEMLSELESVEKLVLVECVRDGNYDAEKGRFITYVTPFLDGAMRRHLECSIFGSGKHGIGPKGTAPLSSGRKRTQRDLCGTWSFCSLGSQSDCLPYTFLLCL